MISPALQELPSVNVYPWRNLRKNRTFTKRLLLQVLTKYDERTSFMFVKIRVQQSKCEHSLFSLIKISVKITLFGPVPIFR
mmetsp:Transcript_10317/g.11199  ORF Transcript_10317/g.11199 Transcript_10317/m.11199 type:complete len:81 (-) Transcript_10317:61-303(-)